MDTKIQRILILCKTYPSPSSRYTETSCVAGMTESGQLIRLFPVPFRMVSDEQQFKKWQWISARVVHAHDDHRPESHRVFVDTIDCSEPPLPTAHAWAARRAEIDKLRVFDDFDALEQARISGGVTLGVVRPSKIKQLRITPVAAPDWTENEKAKLLQEQNQDALFDNAEEKKALKLLKKLPFDFHYAYECTSGEVTKTYIHKLVDWEAGALYWNIHRTPDWQAGFRQKFEADLPKQDLMFLMGTIHRFPNQWLIVSVLYPPRITQQNAAQGSLFGP